MMGLPCAAFFGIPLAPIVGWLFFDKAPVGDLFPGVMLIVLGGMMEIWRERKLARKPFVEIK